MLEVLSYLFYYISSSLAPLQRRHLATRKNPDNIGQIHFAFQVTLLGVPLSFLLLFYGPFILKGNVVEVMLLTLACGIFSAGFFICSYTSQKYVEAGVTGVIGNIYTPIVIVLSTFFLGEGLTRMQLFGTLRLLVGIFVVSQKHRTGRFTFDKYFVLMFLSGIFLSGGLIAERALQKTTGFTAGTMLSWWAACLFLGLITYFTKGKSPYSKMDITITGTLRFLQVLSWATLIFVVGNLSLVSAVTTFKVVIMFVAGAIFLKERDDLPKKLLGSLIAIAGLLLMR